MADTLPARLLTLRTVFATLLALPVPGSAQAPQGDPPLRRWLEIDLAQLATRYRRIENSAGLVTSDHLQHRQQFRARLDVSIPLRTRVGVVLNYNLLPALRRTGVF